MKKILLNSGIGFGMLSIPFATFAAAEFTEASEFIGNLIIFINSSLVPFIFALAFLVFIWGVAQYFIFSRGSEDGQEKGKDLMLWGIIGFFVMVAIWGIVNLLVSGSGLGGETLNTENLPEAPRLK